MKYKIFLIICFLFITACKKQEEPAPSGKEAVDRQKKSGVEKPTSAAKIPKVSDASSGESKLAGSAGQTVSQQKIVTLKPPPKLDADTPKPPNTGVVLGEVEKPTSAAKIPKVSDASSGESKLAGSAGQTVSQQKIVTLKPPPKLDADTPKPPNTGVVLGEKEVFNFCTFPNSLKKAIEEKLNMDCTFITPAHLAEIKQLKIKNIKEGETNLLIKDYAPYFSSLEDLDVSENPQMLSLPAFVTHLFTLNKLNVSKTGISNFPKEMCNLNSLTTLLAAHNNYEGREVPMAVFCLVTLKVLDMSYSSIRYIDEYIGHLSFLEEFYMSGNSLFLIPKMLPTLPHLILVDFRNNNLKNEDLNALKSCRSLKGEKQEECQEGLLDSIKCEHVHELPFQRGEPLRQIYTNLAGQKSQELIKQCEDGEKDNEDIYCPNFITKCRDYPEYDREQCMLDEFESVKAENKHKIHRDKCYITWASWLVDYEKYPEILNKTIRGRTIREIRYINGNQTFLLDLLDWPWNWNWLDLLDWPGNWNLPDKLACWERPWENIHTFGGYVDSAPEKYGASPFEVFPKVFREPGVASRMKARAETKSFVNYDIFWWVPKDCPHLPSNLKERIKKMAEEPAQEDVGK